MSQSEATTASKRELSSSSIEENVEKKQRTDDEMPQWAKAVFTSLMADVAHTKNNTNHIVNTVNDMKNDISKITSEVEKVKVRCDVVEEKHDQLDTKVVSLERKVDELEDSLAEQTDRSMRSSITIHNIEKGPKETWDETKEIAAKFFAEHLPGDQREWPNKIERAHRGRTTVIHCRFESWRFAEEVREKFREKRGKIGNIFILDKFTICMQDRRAKANDTRKNFRQSNPGAKAYIRYPAILMGKKIIDDRYYEITRF